MLVAAGIARGDSSALVRSVLSGVSDEAWTNFVRALATQGTGDVSDSEGLGCFEMRYRRLADLGLVVNLMSERKRLADGTERQVQRGAFVAPLTRDRFLANYLAQYNAFAASMEKYDEEIGHGARLSDEMTRAGALAVMHRAGSGGLKSWAKTKFPATLALYERAKDCF